MRTQNKNGDVTGANGGLDKPAEVILQDNQMTAFMVKDRNNIRVIPSHIHPVKSAYFKGETIRHEKTL